MTKEKLLTGLGVVSLAVPALNVVAFAEETGVAASVATALTSVQGVIMGVLSAVAPVAMVVAGAFLAWKFGMRFFKSIAK